MKEGPRILLLGVAVVALMWWGTQAVAFHDEGVGDCQTSGFHADLVALESE